MKVLVTHHYWDRPGGGELVAGAFTIAFNELGHYVELTATTRFCVPCYKDWFGMDLTKFKVHALPFKLRVFGIYLRALSWLPATWVIPKLKPDLVFMDFYQTKPILWLKRRFKYKTIEYIHFPFESVYGPRKIRSWKDDPYLAERYGRFPWNLYLVGSLWLGERFNRGNPFEVHELVMANSRWTTDLVRQIHGEYPMVVNPPLPPNVSVIMEPKPFDERQNVVVMVGRFSNEKRYHWVVSEVMPRLIKEIPGVKLIIIGGTGTVPSENYFAKTIELTRKVGVIDSVVLMKNAPGDAKLNALDNAKVFLHATVNEHWGVAVAEAMARGLPVVVHKSGGAWSDLAMRGEVGLGYETVDEAVNAIAKLLTDDKEWALRSWKSTERVTELEFKMWIRHIKDKVVSRL